MPKRSKKSLVSRFRQRRKEKQRLKAPKNKIIGGRRYELLRTFKTKDKQTERYNSLRKTIGGKGSNWSVRRVKVKGKFTIYMRHKDFKTKH